MDLRKPVKNGEKYWGGTKTKLFNIAKCADIKKTCKTFNGHKVLWV